MTSSVKGFGTARTEDSLLQINPQQLDGCVAGITGLVILAQGYTITPPDGTVFGHRGLRAIAVADRPFTTTNVDIELIAGVRMDALPLARFYDELLHHELVVLEENFSGNIGVVLVVARVCHGLVPAHRKD